MAWKMAQNGIVAFRFDFTDGLGESDGKMEDIKFTEELKDLKAVVDFVAEQDFIDEERMALAGHSLGGKLF